MKGEQNNMKIDFIYWNTFYEYLINNFKLNGDLSYQRNTVFMARGK